MIMTETAENLLLVIIVFVGSAFYFSIGIGFAKSVVKMGFQETIQIRHVLVWFLYIIIFAATDKVET
ncbi:MAG: hypothetical protein KTR16_11380 [Acidiferrobacterales bacterium]|nr:hypothetical protein [Acidiferrobacterales bacterium]